MPDFKQLIDEALLERLNAEHIGNSLVADAMRYAILNGGKRVRPQLLVRFLYDLTDDYHAGILAALALEMVHTYSLVHDDLPAMDNDDYRRNQLTVHKKFSEDIAILAGDGLLTEAFVALAEGNYPSKVTGILSDHAGVKGMIYGQELDLKLEDKEISLEQLKEIHRYKTGKLLSAPFMMACVIANREEYLKDAEEIGMMYGLAFQIQDDILDVTKNLKKEGEESSDLKNHKNTYVKYMSVKEAKQQVKDLYDKILDKLNALPLKHETTVAFLESLFDRDI